jgi:predicted kinase
MGALIVICGLSFSGKSTLARAITGKFAFEEIDVDDVGATLYGPNFQDKGIKDLDFDRIYDKADALIEARLKSGATVVDASRNFRRAERERARALADRSNARFVTIFVDIPVGIARQRRRRNKISQARRDITDDEFEEIVQVMQPPTEEERPLTFHHGDDIESWLREFASAMTRP